MTSKIDPAARIASTARIGDFCKIYGNVVIEDDVVVDDYCILGHPSARADGTPLVVRKGSHIRSHSVFYEGSSFGAGLVTGHRVTVRENTKAGDGFQIGTLCDIQGHCAIGDHVKTHSSVHICQTATIEDYVWIFPYVVLTNDPHPPSDGHLQGPTIRRYAVIATHACVMPGVEVGEDSLVAAAALVTRDVAPGTVVGGVPAKRLADTAGIRLRGEGGGPAYPWRRHFHRGYPPEVVAGWRAEFSED